MGMRGAEKIQPIVKGTLWALLAGGGYFLLALMGMATTVEPQGSAIVWPASGFLVGLLALQEQRRWPALLAGGVVGSACASLVFGDSADLAAYVALANMVEVVLAAWLPQRIRGAPLRMDSVVDAVWFFLLAVLVVPGVGATLGIGASVFHQGKPSWNTLHLWWMADGLGILLVTPFILALRQERRGLGGWRRARLAEVAALLATLAVVAVLIYSPIQASPILLFPIVSWAALRFGVLGVSSLMLGISAVAVTETLLGNPMGNLFVGFAPYTLLDVQAFLSVTALSALGLAAALAERRKVKEALLDAHRRKDMFLATLSHELRNPLAPIRNSLFILDRILPHADQARRALATIDRQVTYLTRLVGDLLDVTRISHGKIELHRERLDLRKVVQRTVEDHRPLFAAHNLQLHFLQAGSPLWVEGDETRLAQALGNLLNNAVKFTPAGGTVTVTLHKEAGLGLLSVRDNGVGLPADLMAHLFEPFAQADRSLDRRSGGLGLGLALAQGMVRLHGGRIEARSVGVGQGSEFTIYLPLRAKATSESAGIKGAEACARSSTGLQVLVIEDNPDAAETLKTALELNGHGVRVAANGREGLAQAHQVKPDVVFCDIGLPDMNGYDVARAFRREEEFQDTVLVALTGYATPEDSRKAKEAGFDRHLAKPLDLHMLETILATEPPSRRPTPRLTVSP